MSAYPTNQIQRIGPLPDLLAQGIAPFDVPQVMFAARTRTRIDRIVLTSLVNMSATYFLYHKRNNNNTTPVTAEALAYNASIGAHEMKIIDGPFYMVDGDSLWLQGADADHLKYTIYGTREDAL